VKLAELMGVPIQLVNTIIAGKRSVTAKTALLLAKVFGTTPGFWMSLQTAVDIFKARKSLTAKEKSPKWDKAMTMEERNALIWQDVVRLCEEADSSISETCWQIYGDEYRVTFERIRNEGEE